MKKVLIISPHFPPVNAADMHRVRQSLPYFEQFGWKPTVLTVEPEFVEMAKDPILEQSLPKGIEIHKVRAFSTKYTRKVGLGNLGLRAFFQLKRKGNELLRKESFDLIYFSTTAFSCMPLGRLWKKRFKVPFVLDIQDPWRNDYYLSVPKEKRPPKFWFAHRLNSKLEKFTVPHADGLIAVSEGYIRTFKSRYPVIKNIPEKVLTFGVAVRDFEIVKKLNIHSSIELDSSKINFVYVGRGGHDMAKSLSIIFQSFQQALKENSEMKKVHFTFVGTSYAPDGKGKKSIEPIAQQYGVENHLTEITDRKPYFEVLQLLIMSDAIIIPGSEDANYTASKLYPNIVAKKPLLSVFNSNSSVVKVLSELNAGTSILMDKKDALKKCQQELEHLVENIPFEPETNWEKLEPYTAEYMTKVQTVFFDEVLHSRKLQ